MHLTIRNRTLCYAFSCYNLVKVRVIIFSLLAFTLTVQLQSQQSINFQYTGRVQSWRVPSCVTRVKIEVWGAQGGSSMDCAQPANIQQDGGLGGYTVGELNVGNGQLLYILVGGQGKVGSNYTFDGGFNGGGDGGRYGAGGGGATDIRSILNDLDSRIIVAGGGGGGNTGCPVNTGTGGSGGGATGGDGISLYVWGPGGGGGTAIAGGAAGFTSGGQAGTWGQGGNAGNTGNPQFHISGGGGGWYGGGSAYGAGGGGGSGMSGMMGYDTLENGISQNGIRTGNGIVVITLLEGAECVACQLQCKSKVNISMPANDCYLVISPDQVLSGINSGCTTFGYGLEITYPFGTSRLYGNDVDRSHLGQTLIYTVKDGVNSCWGYITLEDKAPPVAGCNGTQYVSCYQLAKLLDVTSQVIDNCSSKNTATIERLTFTDLGCNNPLAIGRINRTIRTTDSWGNTATCSDTLFIQKDSLQNTLQPDLVTLPCKMICKSINKVADQSDYEEINFSKNPSDKYYPTPELLLQLQHQDTLAGDQPCISPDLRVVPYLFDSVLVWEDGIYHKEWLPVDQYPFKSSFCRITVSYTDKVLDVCPDGSAFKIRRQWRITDWCTDQEKLFIQYIEIIDRDAPALFRENGGVDPRDNRLSYRFFVQPHSCQANVELKELVILDCSPNVKQDFTASYIDISHPGKTIVQQGTLPGKLLLPAISGVFGARCHNIEVSLVDGCLNRFDTIIVVCVVDETPPELLIDGPTRLTVDPATCWSRVYAKDLDNGSRDNCCDVLHFAIADMDSIESARHYVYDAILAQCGVKEYQANKDYYDYYIEDYISSYIFKDYLDLAACQEYRIVVRVWEACGIPRFDPHIWPCSEHQWFLYNAGYPRSHYRADHNLNFGFSQNADYTKFNAPKDCNWRYPLIFCDPLLAPWFAQVGLDDFSPAYIGAGATELCNFDFYWPRLGLKGNSINGSGSGNPPGNTCSRMLWKDGMVRVTVDDKTPPVAENPEDIFWYCDNVSTTQDQKYEFALCEDNLFGEDNAKDYTCLDGNLLPYHEIECVKENDGNLSDAKDPVGSTFGWYGCNSYGLTHEDEHGDPVPCESGPGTWIPVYCRSWLCLDAFDHAGKISPDSAFSRPLFHNGPPGSATAGAGRFLIWDNCTLDTSSLSVQTNSVLDACGNGWLLRTWSVRDNCGNSISVDQKIVTKHRSDFEAVFPPDVYTFCSEVTSLTPDITGKPIILDDECELVGVIYSDEKFDIVSDACYKIVRTWRLIDWCKFNLQVADKNRQPDVVVDDRWVADSIQRPCVYRNIKDNGDGLVSYVQVIKVRDTLAPDLFCRDTTICILDQNCISPAINLVFNGSDACTPSSQLSYRWELDHNPSPSDLLAKKYIKNNIDQKSSGPVTALNIIPAPGKSLVHVMTHDRCGNEDTCSFVLTTLDCKKPTPYCYNGIATLVMSPTGKVDVWANDLDAGSYDNCTLKSKLTFSFGPDKTQTKREFSCLDIPNGKSATITLNVYVWDEAGQFDFCQTYLLLQDGLANTCPDNLTGINVKSRISVPLTDNPATIELPDQLPDINSLNSPHQPSGLSLLQNQPNPFNSNTWIQFRMAEAIPYQLIISDLSGRTVWMRNGNGIRGLNRIEVKGQDLSGLGVFYYTLITAEYKSTKKMILTN